MQELLTSGEVARLLGISPRTVRRYLVTGRIVAEQHPITGRWKIGRDAVLRFAAEHGMTAMAIDADRCAPEDKVGPNEP